MEGEWKDLFSGKRFITDLGGREEAEVDGAPAAVERYAVWVPQGQGHQIVEVGADLEDLCERYQIGAENVCLLIRG